MDYDGLAGSFLSDPKPVLKRQPNDAIVLACKSEPYFASRLRKTGAYPLVVTTGLMAPEAYSLHAAVMTWLDGVSDIQVKKAAADSYSTFQKINRKASERLFGVK